MSNGTGMLSREGGAEIINFPGREEKLEAFPTISKLSAIEGEIVRVGGIGKAVPVLLRSESDMISHCVASKITAKALAQRLFKHVRLFGQGQWARNEDGEWMLRHFKIARFDVLKDVPLSEALATFRSLPPGDWSGDPFADLHELRYGPEGMH